MSVQVLHGDCREVMPHLIPAASIDCVITDPPYGETSLAWDQRVDGWLGHVRRVLKPHGSLWVFGSLRFFMQRAADFAEWHFIQDLVWEKQNGSGAAADRFRRVHECVAQFQPADVPWSSIYRQPVFTPDATARTLRHKRRPPHWGSMGSTAYASEDGGPRLMRSVLQVNSCHGEAEHPTQKPEGIIAPLVEYSCPPGGTILDPFAGSGTTGLVAQRLGRQAILIEIDLDYVGLAKRRTQPDLLTMGAPV